MKCTGIKRNDRRAEVIYLCPNDSFLVREEDYALHAASLPQKGEEFSEEAQELILRLDLRACLISRGLTKLSYADNTKKELFRKIRAEKHRGEFPDADAAREAVEYLCGRGLINEKAYCERLYALYASRLYGKGKICLALKKKGFSDRMIEYIGEKSTFDFYESCKKALEKRFSSRPYEKNSAKGYLYRQGFSADEISEALSQDD